MNNRSLFPSARHSSVLAWKAEHLALDFKKLKWTGIGLRKISVLGKIIVQEWLVVTCSAFREMGVCRLCFQPFQKEVAFYYLMLVNGRLQLILAWNANWQKIQEKDQHVGKAFFFVPNHFSSLHLLSSDPSPEIIIIIILQPHVWGYLFPFICARSFMAWLIFQKGAGELEHLDSRMSFMQPWSLKKETFCFHFPLWITWPAAFC